MYYGSTNILREVKLRQNIKLSNYGHGIKKIKIYTKNVKRKKKRKKERKRCHKKMKKNNNPE